MKESDWIAHVKTARNKANNNESKLTPSILQLQGMSGVKTRHFYNNICSHPAAKYLEVGSWKGSTLISALYNNQHCPAVAIDNWSQFNGPCLEFHANCKTYIPESWLFVIENDCFNVSLSNRKFNIFLFDGAHDYDSQKKAITYFYKNLELPCVVIIDDWNWQSVRSGTYDGLHEVGANIVYEDHVRLTQDDSHTNTDLARDSYWNGMGVFVIGRKRVNL